VQNGLKYDKLVIDSAFVTRKIIDLV